MYWKYTRFETNLLLHNRKNSFLGLVFVLFFVFFFNYFSDSQPQSILDLKRIESSNYISIFNQFPETLKETPEGEEIFQNLKEQSTLVNYQVFYITRDGEAEYIENGFRLTELRLRVHELGNQGVPDHFVIPVEEIMKEDARLGYIEEHQLPLLEDPVTASNYLVIAIGMISGLAYFMFVIVSGSEMLAYEQRHRTVLSGFPISFINKVNSKVSVYFVHIMIIFAIGLVAGGLYAANKSSSGNFMSPVVIYLNGNYEAISMLHYLFYVTGAIVVITIMLLYLSILLNMLFNNAFANLIFGIGLFLLPDLLRMIGLQSTWLQVFKLVDFSTVLSGDMAQLLGNSQIDYWYMLTALIILTLLIVSIIFWINKLSFFKKN